MKWELNKYIIIYPLKRTLYCGQMPRLERILSISVRISKPLIVADPEVGGNNPVKIDLYNGKKIKINTI